MLPDWIKQNNPSEPSGAKPQQPTQELLQGIVNNTSLAGCKCKVPPVGRKGFVQRTIDGTAGFFRETILTETFAGRKGLLQALDPRVKLVTILLIIGSISVLRSPVTIWGVYGFSLLLSLTSMIPLIYFLKRVWLFVPLFSAIIVIPAVFNVITPGEPVWTILTLTGSHGLGPYHIPSTIAVTRQGVLTAIIFLGRVAASVSFAVLMTLTTRWNNLLQALKTLRIPSIFVLILGMAYRYVALLVQAVQDMHIARKSRTLHYGPTGDEQRWVASRIGYLFKKTYVMSQDVHNAMLSRGFSGEIRTLTVFRAKKYDYAWGLFVMVICAVALYSDHIMLS